MRRPPFIYYVLFPLVVQLVTVILRGLFHSSAKTMVVVSAEKALWETAATSVKRTIFTTALGLAARSARPVTGW